MAITPMFPLGTVLLPGSALPLHVFEPRYRQLVIDCLQKEGRPEFGQVLITHGSEAGGGDQRAMVGTVAQMADVQALDESRYAFIAVGVRRLRVRNWLPDVLYPRADIEDWPDENPEPPGSLDDRIANANVRVRAAIDLFVQLGEAERAGTAEHDENASDSQTGSASAPRRPASELAGDPVLATYQLASRAPIGPADRYRLLAASGPSERLDVLDEVLDDVEAVSKFRLT